MRSSKNILRYDAFRQQRTFATLRTPGLLGNPSTVFTAFFIAFGFLAFLGFMAVLAKTPLIILMTVLVILCVIYIFRQDALHSKQNVKIFHRFAKDNNLEVSKEEFYYSDGIVFAFGNNDHKTGWIFRGKMHSYPIALYWHFFTSGRGKSIYEYRYAVAEIDLPKSLPHIFLGNKNNNTRFSNKEELDIFKKEHLLELEGDFPQHFTVYADKKQAAYVLTILNPSFMQALIDTNAPYDLELVGKKAFLYFPRRWGPTTKEIKPLWEGADFIIKQLEKQLDTFGSHKNQTKLKTSITKISLKGL